MELFKRKTERLAQIAYPVIKRVYENQGHMYENILIPITDGKRMYNISCNLKAAYESECKEGSKKHLKSLSCCMSSMKHGKNLRELDELETLCTECQLRTERPAVNLQAGVTNLFDTMVDKITIRQFPS